MKKDGALLAIAEDFAEVVKTDAFAKHMKDAIDYRVMSYYRNRGMKTQ